MQLSAIIITLNEEERLEKALLSLSFCDEIVVVDSGSTDGTLQIARSLGACVYSHPWRGYAAQKNLAAEKAKHDWILALDADEAVSVELEREIRELSLPDCGYAAFSFPRIARYLGRWIRHSGWYPDRKIRLYDRRRARWVGDYVHESVAADGPVGRLNGDLRHDTCDSIGAHVRSVDRYTTLAAQEIVSQGGPSGWLRLAMSPLWAFFRSWILRAGFRDGLHGFVIAWMAAFYVFLKHAKVWDARQRTS